MTRSHSHPIAQAGRFVGVAVAYFLAARLGVAFIAEPESIAVFWPPAGLLLGYLLLTPRRDWPVALAAAFTATVAANLLVGKSFGLSAGLGVVNALEPAAGAWIIGRLRPGAFRLRSARELFLLLGVSAVVCAAAAVGGAAAVAVGAGAPFWSAWKVWWLADALGVVLFAPLVVCWADSTRAEVARQGPRVLAEAGVTFGILAAVSWGIFATPVGEKPLLLTLPYPVFPVLLWTAIRLGSRGTSLAVILVSLIAVWGSAQALGPVSAPGLAAADRILVVQGFCAVVSLSTFLLAVAIAERRERERDVLTLNESLRSGLAERQSALQDLQSQKQILESILDSMGEAVLVTDAAGTVVMQNRAFRNLHDVSPPAAPAEWPRAFGVYLPDGGTLCPSERLPIFRATSGEACDNVELLIVDQRHPDGLPVSVTGRPIMGPSGVEGGVIAIRDVSDVRRAETKLRDSEQQYRLLVNGVRDYAIFLLDPTGNVASWNIGAEQIKGYSEEEVVGKHFSTFYPAEDVAAGKTDRVLRLAAETGQYEEEGWRVRKDGSRFWAHVVISAIFDSNDQLRGFAKSTRDLTAKRDAERALKRSEDRFRAIFDQTLQFIGLMSSDGTLLEANRTALAATGIVEEEVIGQKFWDTPWWAHDAAQQERLRDAVRRAAAGATVRFEAHHPAADGSTIWVDFSLKPYVADGDVVYLIPEGRDVTDRKRTELALAANEALLHQFVKHAPAAIAMLDTRLRYIRTSDQWVTDYRLTGRDIIGRSHYEVFPDVPDRWKEIHQRVLAGAVERCAEDPFPRDDGSTEWLQWEARPWYEPGGSIGGLIFFTQVITARKRTEEALRIGEERLRLALENAKHGLWDWDVRTGSVFYDETWLAIHGYAPGELVVDYAWWESSIHPDDRARVLATLQRGLNSDEALYDVEYRARRKDGVWVWINSRGRVQSRDAAGNALRMMGTLHDIGERKRGEEELLRSVREKEVMLREIHHRVKNNLAVISSLFHLQATGIQDARIAQVLREAQDRVRSMALVHEHLYNSADLGAVAFGEYAKTLATQIIQTYQLPTTPIELICRMSEVRLTVEQAIPCGLILNELLSNCLKHAFQNRASGRVTLSIAATGGVCEIIVTDDGVGVPKELDVKLGKSLGVRLIRILTRQLVGSVEYTSPGTGTEVRLAFPILSPAKN